MLITDITIGDRHRKDMGDLLLLSCSIAAEGLLQPIGVTANNELVFGERRLLACRDILGMTEIDVRVVDVTSIVAGEREENEIRKDFTPSERVAIAKTVEAQLGNRQGQRTDLEHTDSGPEVMVGETRDIVAGKSGFNSGKEYERAKKVVESGTPELVEAMDSGEVSISKAAQVSKLPPDKQREVMNAPPDRRGKTLVDCEAEMMKTRTVDEKVFWTLESCRSIVRDRVPVDQFAAQVHPHALRNLHEWGPQVITIIEEILSYDQKSQKHDKRSQNTAA